MPTIVKVKTETMPQGDALKAYLNLVEKYKIQNPVKYQNKKAAFDAKLAALGFKETK